MTGILRIVPRSVRRRMRSNRIGHRWVIAYSRRAERGEDMMRYCQRCGRVDHDWQLPGRDAHVAA